MLKYRSIKKIRYGCKTLPVHNKGGTERDNSISLAIQPCRLGFSATCEDRIWQNASCKTVDAPL